MPELAEVEAYRRLAEARALHRPITEVTAGDAWYLKGGISAPDVTAALLGRTLVGAERQGKLLLLSTSDDGPVLGLRFGMSGRLIVDDTAGVDDLWYGSNREEPRWDRFALGFADGGRLAMRDPRRLGGVTLDPSRSRLGPDALMITVGQLRYALAPGRRAGSDSGGAAAGVGTAGSGPAGGGMGGRSGRSAPTSASGPVGVAGPAANGSRMSLKGRLMDQSRLAGVGNLAADEILWRAGLDPTRPASSLSDAELRRLQRHLRSTLQDFLDRGGSHTGELMAQRRRDGHCPKDGTPLVRATVATRTTYWCPKHQH